MPNTPTALQQSPWHGGWLSPLNLAALVTWLAVLLDAPRWARLLAGDGLQLLGAAALLAFMAAFASACFKRQRGGGAQAFDRAMVCVQALMALLASWCLRNGAPAILLIIVAGQALAIWPWRQGLAVMLAANLALLAIWLQGLTPVQAVLALLPMLGFQTFAGLTVHYATSAERARVALAQTHAQLLATQQLLEDAARSGERLRLSRELHDVAGHKLTALKLNLRLLQRDPALAARTELAVAGTLADELLEDIRSVVSELRRHDGIDLAAALKTLAGQVPGTDFSIQIDPELRAPDVHTAEVLLRVAQEGITNALRHGRARSIVIRCRKLDGRIQLQVGNDGAVLTQPVYGNGLTGMRERLAAVGGELSLQPRSGGGADLWAELPIHAHG